MRHILNRLAAVLPLIIGAGWSGARADVVLPAILSDGMVLQQGAEVAIWGWARPGEAVQVSASWGGELSSVVADDRGRWLARIKTPRVTGADAHTSHDVTVRADNTVTLHDVLIGEVWVCSGQSNMEWNLGGIGGGRDGPAGRIPGAAEEIAQADFPIIRLFNVPNAIAAQPRSNVSTTSDGAQPRWAACSPQTAASFSAVGYFFGRELCRTLHVPIGLVSADWGGTPAEAWMSAEGLGEFAEFVEPVALVKALADPNRRAEFSKDQLQAWWDSIDALSGAPGREWTLPSFDDSAWKDMTLPATLGAAGAGAPDDRLDRYDGFVYFRRTIEVPETLAGKDLTLALGPIDDRDDVYFNGEHVGSTRADGQWGKPRVYSVPARLAVAGKVVVGIRMLDTAGPGGVNGTAESMTLSASEGGSVALAGAWRYHAGPGKQSLPPMPDGASTRQLGPGSPTSLSNGMISPIEGMTIRGVIWYQGESNVGRASQYSRLFPALIRDWRRRFNSGEGSDWPFYFVQIAPFKYGNDRFSAAELRESQARALKVPNVGMACTIDLGNPDDIHPDNKQEVGRRLALLALSNDYGKKDVVAGGPSPSGVRTDGSSLRIQFSSAAGGIIARGQVRGIHVAGEDRRFFEAAIEVQGDTIRASSSHVPNPVAARYGFSAAPEGVFFNNAGLPMPPFRTDDWPADTVRYEDGGRTSFLTDDPGFTPLFNGSNLEGWVPVNTAPSTWTVQDGMIICSGKPTGVLRTEKQYRNFIVEFEWRHLVAGGNAGFFVWSDAITARGQPFTRSVEVQVMDGQEGDWFTSDGDIFPIHGAVMKPENGRGGSRAFPTEKRARPSPEWNHYRVECRDGAISLAVNGAVVSRGSEINPRLGYLCLESEGSEVHFRNLRIKELPENRMALPPEALAASDEGFRSLYNGIDFTGWKHGPAHEGHWSAADWTMAFDGQGEDLWSESTYRNFELICDWRWTASAVDADLPVILPTGEQDMNTDGTPKTARTKEAGDSGIYLRGNSKSQVNIWCWPIGSGEVYGYRTDTSMPADVRAGVTPKVAADAPIGEWNRFHIVMVGDRLSVNLNGMQVLDRAHLPGVPESGPIALQKHGGALEFANLYIKELPDESPAR